MHVVSSCVYGLASFDWVAHLEHRSHSVSAAHQSNTMRSVLTATLIMTPTIGQTSEQVGQWVRVAEPEHDGSDTEQTNVHSL